MSTKNLNKYQQANSDSSSELFRLTPVNAYSKLLLENRINRQQTQWKSLTKAPQENLSIKPHESTLLVNFITKLRLWQQLRVYYARNERLSQLDTIVNYSGNITDAVTARPRFKVPIARTNCLIQYLFDINYCRKVLLQHYKSFFCHLIVTEIVWQVVCWKLRQNDGILHDRLTNSKQSSCQSSYILQTPLFSE